MLNFTVLTDLYLHALQSSTCLFFSLLLSHAIYFKVIQSTFAQWQCYIWAHALLNKSTHAAETQETTHTLLAQEFTKIEKKCGVAAVQCPVPPPMQLLNNF